MKCVPAGQQVHAAGQPSCVPGAVATRLPAPLTPLPPVSSSPASQIVNPGVGEGGQALEACLTPDGQYVLSGNPDRSIRAWRVQVRTRALDACRLRQAAVTMTL